MKWWIWFLVAGYLLVTGFVIWQMSFWVGAARSAGHLGRLKWVIPFISIFSVFPILGTFLPDSRVSAFFMRWGNVWVGILGAIGVMMIVALATRIFVHPVSVKYANAVVIVTMAFAFGINLYGILHARNVTTTYWTVEISEQGAKLIDDEATTSEDQDTTGAKQGTASADSPDEQRVRIAFISDLHMGVNTSMKHIKSMIKTINNESVDLVLGGGDYFTSSYIALKDAQDCAQVLRGIRAKKGTYYALGNHDVSEQLFCGFAITDKSEAIRFPEMDAFFDLAGWDIKQDEVVEIDGVQYVFRKDAEKTGDGINKRKSVDEIMAEVDTSKPVVVIEHEPNELIELEKAGADLVLSGHTHAGQIVPGNIYGLIDAEKNNSNCYGDKQYGKLLSLVSSGVGYFGPPIRIGTDSEIMIVDLVIK